MLNERFCLNPIGTPAEFTAYSELICAFAPYVSNRPLCSGRYIFPFHYFKSDPLLHVFKKKKKLTIPTFHNLIEPDNCRATHQFSV